MLPASRREFLALAATVTTGLVARGVSLTSASSPITVTGSTQISVLRTLGRALDRNVLKLFRVVTDASRNRVYVAGIMSPYIAVLDGDTHAPIRTFDTGIAGNALKFLALDEGNNRLYVRDTSNGQLLALDLNTGGRIGPVPLAGVSGGMATDPNRGLLFLPSQDAPGLQALDGATFAASFTSSAFGTTVTSLLADSVDDVLYGLDSTKGEGRIYKMRLSDRSTTAIEFRMNPNWTARAFQWSRSGQRFFVCVPGQGVLCVSPSGTIERTLDAPDGMDFADMSLDDRQGRLFVLFQEPPASDEVAGTGAHLWTYDGRSWEKSAAFGIKPQSIVANAATGRFYSPAGDESTVWWGEGTATSASAVRVGDSIESVVLAGGLVYMNSRLGGSHLLACQPDGSGMTSFTAGTWPVVMCADTNGRTMVVLNAWDSTLSIFELPSRNLVATIPIGLPAGTTDRLPDLAVDFSRNRAYAAYPEFGKVAVVDLQNRRALSALAINGFATGDTGGGPNQMEVAVSESSGRLLVYCGSLRRLSAYDISGSSPSLVADTETPPASGGERLAWKLMFVDATRDRVFVGRDIYDARTGRSTGTRIGAGQKLFAVDETRDVYWSVTVADEIIAVHTLDRSGLGVVDTQDLGPADYLAPALALDVAGGRLYVSHLTAATLDIYRIT
ncbi:MAG TPA: hypothetical protein VNT81_23550 [Vicinamibacterales bacterium]|nr:hypothetical protein [Vicinamibacterales bacterium]